MPIDRAALRVCAVGLYRALDIAPSLELVQQPEQEELARFVAEDFEEAVALEPREASGPAAYLQEHERILDIVLGRGVAQASA